MTTSEDHTIKNRVLGLETAIDEFHKRLEVLESTGAMNHRDIQALGDKIDGIREDLKEFKGMSMAFMPRQELEGRLAKDEVLIQNLQTDFKAAQLESHIFQVDILKNLHSNTIATYGTFLFGLISFLSVILTILYNTVGLHK